MKLTVRLPARLLLDEEPVARVRVECENGALTLRPRHLDVVTTLAPGILAWDTVDGRERFAAVDRGILVKCGDEVMVAVRDGVPGGDLESLERTVREHLLNRDEREKHALAALARLEGRLVRSFLDLGWGDHA